MRFAIDILLATYNGAAHLGEQIDSLLSQEFRDWRLLVRDDGSDDGTAELLESYAARFIGKIRTLPNRGIRLGPSGNFSELMLNSDAEYFMLCDQDDVWMPGKTGSTLEEMKKLESEYGRDKPLLVHTDFRVVDESLNVLADSGWRYQKIDPERNSLNRLLVQNVATGCTVMFNRALRNLALPVPPDAVMHDWWLALVAGAFGGIGHLPEPLLLYRQHGVNSVGAKSWELCSFMKQMGSLGDVRGAFLKIQRQASVFLEKYDGVLTTKDRRMVQAFSRLAEKGFFEKRYSLLRYGFFHAGFLRKVGMLAFG
jgi:glycosyltransferase involved in cell wall biosynthesis